MGAELRAFMKDFRNAPDRGKSFYQAERERQHLAALVEAGRCAPPLLRAVLPPGPGQSLCLR